METNLVLSLGSLLAAGSMFYSMHKDSKKNTEQMADLKARVKHLEAKSEQTDAVLQELLRSVQEIKVALVKIDTKLDSLEQEFNRDRDKQVS